jgi:hypothetical protein
VGSRCDALDFPLRLPGVIEVLGGPDRVSRRLKALSGLVGNVADLGGQLQGGIDGSELKDLAKTVVETIQDLRDLKD